MTCEAGRRVSSSRGSYAQMQSAAISSATPRRSTGGQSDAHGGQPLYWPTRAPPCFRDCRSPATPPAAPESKTYVSMRSRATVPHCPRPPVQSDWNGGGGGSNTYDESLHSYQGGTVAMTNSQLTFGASSGLRAYADTATVQLGHLTIADYPSAECGSKPGRRPGAPAELDRDLQWQRSLDLGRPFPDHQLHRRKSALPRWTQRRLPLAPSSPASTPGPPGSRPINRWISIATARPRRSNTDLGS